MKHEQDQGYIHRLLPLLLFALLALCLLGLSLGGAGVYQAVTERDGETYEARTVAQYLSTRLRQGEGTVSVEPFGDGDALVLEESIGGERYLTRIYGYKGALWELFAAADSRMAPEDGERLLALAALAVEQEESGLTLRLTHAGGWEEELYFARRQGREVAP